MGKQGRFFLPNRTLLSLRRKNRFYWFHIFLVFFPLALILGFSGCNNSLTPTYREDEIPAQVSRILEEEYKQNVTINRVGNTLWIYLPVEKIFHKDFGVKEDKIFDDVMFEKLRNILTTVSRVLLSADSAPDFFAVVAADTNNGVDYTMVGNLLDVKKTSAGFIPWTEANRRYVIKVEQIPEAKGDLIGKHLAAYEISMGDFLAAQITQRIRGMFQDSDLKQYQKVEKAEGTYKDGRFIFDYFFVEIDRPSKPIDVKKKVLDIIAYCLQSYEFERFIEVEVNDLPKQEKHIYSAQVILERVF